MQITQKDVRKALKLAQVVPEKEWKGENAEFQMFALAFITAAAIRSGAPNFELAKDSLNHFRDAAEEIMQGMYENRLRGRNASGSLMRFVLRRSPAGTLSEPDHAQFPFSASALSPIRILQCSKSVFLWLFAITYWLMWGPIAWRAIRTGRLLARGVIYDRHSTPRMFWFGLLCMGSIGMLGIGLAVWSLAYL